MAVVNRKIIVKQMRAFSMEGIAAYTDASAGDLIGVDNAKVSAVGDPVKGIIVDAQPASAAEGLTPRVLRLATKGDLIEDLELDGVAPGTLIWSDGDGTYSVTQPTIAAGAKSVIFAVVRRIDTVAADTGCEMEILNQVNEDGTA